MTGSISNVVLRWSDKCVFYGSEGLRRRLAAAAAYLTSIHPISSGNADHGIDFARNISQSKCRTGSPL